MEGGAPATPKDRPGLAGARPLQLRVLHIESEFDHIPVLHDIILAFDAQLACFTRFGEGTKPDEIVVLSYFRRDETAFEVGVNDASCLGRFVPGVNCPGARLFFAGS